MGFSLKGEQKKAFASDEAKEGLNGGDEIHFLCYTFQHHQFFPNIQEKHHE